MLPPLRPWQRQWAELTESASFIQEHSKDVCNRFGIVDFDRVPHPAQHQSKQLAWPHSHQLWNLQSASTQVFAAWRDPNEILRHWCRGQVALPPLASKQRVSLAYRKFGQIRPQGGQLFYAKWGKPAAHRRHSGPVRQHRGDWGYDEGAV